LENSKAVDFLIESLQLLQAPDKAVDGNENYANYEVANNVKENYVVKRRC
jgi:hypothetical protein